MGSLGGSPAFRIRLVDDAQVAFERLRCFELEQKMVLLTIDPFIDSETKYRPRGGLANRADVVLRVPVLAESGIKTILALYDIDEDREQVTMIDFQTG